MVFRLRKNLGDLERGSNGSLSSAISAIASNVDSRQMLPMVEGSECKSFAEQMWNDSAQRKRHFVALANEKTIDDLKSFAIQRLTAFRSARRCAYRPETALNPSASARPSLQQTSTL
jgi:hypothetical protein